MNKKISVGITISLMLIASAITFILTSNFTLNTINEKVTNVSEREKIYNKIGDIDTQVKEHFYGNINEDNVIDAVAEGYMTVLDDKYASYNSPEENEAKTLKQDGKTLGIGITATADESGYILIQSILPNSPAETNNLEAGSLIVAVDGQSVISLGYEGALEKIKGAIGTNVTITIRKDGNEQDVLLTREEINIKSVNFKMIDDIAYIQITTFDNTTASQFSYALSDAQENGATAIIFDVRNNLGGLLTPCLDMLDTLLPSGPIGYSTDKSGETTVLKESDSSQINLPMAVLINSRTASASELFSGALSDYNKAVLVGSTTYGKGVMQGTYSLSDGSSVTFTIGTFKSAKSSNWDGVGIKPNYEVIMENDTESDLLGLDETSDLQLKKAIEILTTTAE